MKKMYYSFNVGKGKTLKHIKAFTYKLPDNEFGAKINMAI